MSEQTLSRIAGTTILLAGLIAAAATAAELVTSPYNPTVSLYALDGPVHLIKYVAMLALLVSLPAAYVAQRATAGKLGFAGLVLLLVGLGLAGTPYNIMEMSLSPSLSVGEASAAWDELWSAPTLLGPMAGLGFVGFIFGIVSFGIASRRAGGWFRRAAVASFLGLGAAIGLMLVELPAFVPHAPTWLLLGLAVYGIAAVRRGASVSEGAGAQWAAERVAG